MFHTGPARLEGSPSSEGSLYKLGVMPSATIPATDATGILVN